MGELSFQAQQDLPAGRTEIYRKQEVLLFPGPRLQ